MKQKPQQASIARDIHWNEAEAAAAEHHAGYSSE
jgi:hypothetical protein